MKTIWKKRNILLLNLHFDDIDERLFERDFGKKVRQFFNLLVWGEVNKQIENASEKYKEICNDNFKNNMDREVTEITQRFIDGLKYQKEEIKKDIDEALKIQLDEKERYKIMTEEEQKVTGPPIECTRYGSQLCFLVSSTCLTELSSLSHDDNINFH